MPYKPCSLHNTTPSSTLTQVNCSENITVVTYTLLTLLQVPINPPLLNTTPITTTTTTATTSTGIDSKSEVPSTKRMKKTTKGHNSDLSSTTALNTAMNKGQNYDRNVDIKSSISESEAMISYWVSNILGVRRILTYYIHILYTISTYIYILYRVCIYSVYECICAILTYLYYTVYFIHYLPT